MKFSWLIIIILLFTSCKSDSADEKLLSSWQHIESLIDIGDGNGTFSPVDSKKVITFHDNGTVTSTVSFCDNTQEETGMTATYDKNAKLITPGACNTSRQKTAYYFENEFLILNYQGCIEPCLEKYERITQN